MGKIFLFLVLLASGFALDTTYIQKNINALKTEAIYKQAVALQEIAPIPTEYAYKIALELCRHKHHDSSSPRDMAKESIESMQKEAQKQTQEGMLDALKALEDALHLKPGHAFEEGNKAFEHFKEGHNQSMMADQMQRYLDLGRVEQWGNGVFLGPSK